ncbi:hypothetical protein Vpro01_01600 [Vibrio proteolyticus]
MINLAEVNAYLEKSGKYKRRNCAFFDLTFTIQT